MLHVSRHADMPHATEQKTWRAGKRCDAGKASSLGRSGDWDSRHNTSFTQLMFMWTNVCVINPRIGWNNLVFCRIIKHLNRGADGVTIPTKAEWTLTISQSPLTRNPSCSIRSRTPAGCATIQSAPSKPTCSGPNSSSSTTANATRQQGDSV